MHITNQKLSFDIFTVEIYKISSWNMIVTKFLIRKIGNFDPYNVLLAIATNISVLLMTGFVV